MPDGALPPGQHPAKGWPVLHLGPVPSFDPDKWELRVWGAVENPLRLSYGELRSIPSVRTEGGFHCVTSFSIMGMQWEGVAFSELAGRCRPLPEGRWVMAHCEYGYEANLPLEVLARGGALLAWGCNGEDLTPEHGYPLRLVVPERYAWKSAKWVREIEFMDQPRRGFWESRGYHNDADPWAEQRYSYQE